MLEYLGREIEVKIDRPLGSVHPQYGFYYPINYGYIPNAVSGDGEEIDVYVMGEFEPIQKYKGRVIAIIHRNNDNEDKLVVAKEINSYNKEQIKALTEFQERFFDGEIICFDYLKQCIRNTVRGLVRRNNEILVVEEFNEQLKQLYYHLPGGRIEFREESILALEREFKEEFHTGISEMKFLCTIENIFTLQNMKVHEISLIYETILPNKFYEVDEFVITGLFVSKAKWIAKDKFLENRKVLYPEQLKQYL